MARSLDNPLSTELNLDPNNPSPFVQPFLVLHFENNHTWYVDVGGEIDRYVDNYSQLREKFDTVDKALEGDYRKREKLGIPLVLADPMDWKALGTQLLVSMVQGLESFGHKIKAVTIYDGSAGPTHILRNGAFFARLDLTDPVTQGRWKHSGFWNVTDSLPAIESAYAALIGK
jgi:hypothetical protein